MCTCTNLVNGYQRQGLTQRQVINEMVKEVFAAGLSSEEGQIVFDKVLEQINQIDTTAPRENPSQDVNPDTKPSTSQPPIAPVAIIDGTVSVAAIGVEVEGGICTWK